MLRRKEKVDRSGFFEGTKEAEEDLQKRGPH
jgi:hypothetical protein